MYQTLKFMKSLMRPEFSKMSYEQLSAAYQQENNESIIAEVFVRSFQMILTFSKKYFIKGEEASSYSLFIIAKTLQKYKPGKNKYFTYLYQAIRNKFLYTNRKNHNGKNILNANPYHYNGNPVGQPDVPDILELERLDRRRVDPYRTVDFYLTFESLGLTEQELAYVNGILSGKSKKELAKELNISSIIMCELNQSLAFKLAALNNTY